VTLELTRAATSTVSGQSCPVCGAEGHDANALYCKYCGGKL
jgi:voltage-gated potassium channel